MSNTPDNIVSKLIKHSTENENYNLCVVRRLSMQQEAMQSLRDHLKPFGVVRITRSQKLPKNDHKNINKNITASDPWFDYIMSFPSGKSNIIVICL